MNDFTYYSLLLIYQLQTHVKNVTKQNEGEAKISCTAASTYPRAIMVGCCSNVFVVFFSCMLQLHPFEGPPQQLRLVASFAATINGVKLVSGFAFSKNLCLSSSDAVCRVSTSTSKQASKKS